MTDKVREYLEQQKKLHQEGKAAQAQAQAQGAQAQAQKEKPTISQQEIEGVKKLFKQNKCWKNIH